MDPGPRNGLRNFANAPAETAGQAGAGEELALSPISWAILSTFGRLRTEFMTRV